MYVRRSLQSFSDWIVDSSVHMASSILEILVWQVLVVLCVLSYALHLAAEWLCDNHLSLNVQKTKAMLIHSAWRVNLPPLFGHLLSTPFEQVHTTRFLSVSINDTLTWHFFLPKCHTMVLHTPLNMTKV